MQQSNCNQKATTTKDSLCIESSQLLTLTVLHYATAMNIHIFNDDLLSSLRLCVQTKDNVEEGDNEFIDEDNSPSNANSTPVDDDALLEFMDNWNSNTITPNSQNNN